MQTRLERSTTNRIVGGICGGIAEYLQVDATLVRVFFVIVILLTAGFAILGYIALLFLMPMPGQPQPFVRGATANSAATSADAAAPSDPSDPNATMPIAGDTMPFTRPAPPPVPEDPAAAERRRAIFGYFLVGIGAIFLLSNFGAFRLVRGDLLWPLVLVVAGVFILTQRVRS
jgi:phage shock protein C